MSSSWEQLYEKHGDALVLYARQFVLSRAEAEDAVHDGFVRLFGKKRFRDHSNPRALLFQAVRWAALDQLKSNQRRRKRETDAAADLFAEEPIPFSGSGDADFSSVISKLLWELPSEQREVVVLHLWGDLSFREIGEQLSISSNTASSRYRYGLERMRAQSSNILQDCPEQTPPLTVD